MTDSFDRSRADSDERKPAVALTTADFLDLPDAVQELVSWMLRRRKVTFAEVVAQTGQGETAARELVDNLLTRGFIQAIPEAGEVHYRAVLASRKSRPLPQNIWNALEAGDK